MLSLAANVSGYGFNIDMQTETLITVTKCNYTKKNNNLKITWEKYIWTDTLFSAGNVA